MSLPQQRRRLNYITNRIWRQDFRDEDLRDSTASARFSLFDCFFWVKSVTKLEQTWRGIPRTMGLNHLQKQLPQPSQACITWEQPHERPQAFGTTQLSCWFTAPQKLRDNESLLCWATIFGGSLLSINRYRMHLLCTQQPCDTHCKMMLIVTQRLSNFSLSWGENQWKNAGLTCVTPWIPHLTPQRKRIVISPD